MPSLPRRRSLSYPPSSFFVEASHENSNSGDLYTAAHKNHITSSSSASIVPLMIAPLTILDGEDYIYDAGICDSDDKFKSSSPPRNHPSSFATSHRDKRMADRTSVMRSNSRPQCTGNPWTSPSIEIEDPEALLFSYITAEDEEAYVATLYQSLETQAQDLQQPLGSQQPQSRSRSNSRSSARSWREPSPNLFTVFEDVGF